MAFLVDAVRLSVCCCCLSLYMRRRREGRPRGRWIVCDSRELTRLDSRLRRLCGALRRLPLLPPLPPSEACVWAPCVWSRGMPPALWVLPAGSERRPSCIMPENAPSGACSRFHPSESIGHPGGISVLLARFTLCPHIFRLFFFVLLNLLFLFLFLFPFFFLLLPLLWSVLCPPPSTPPMRPLPI